MIFQTKASGNLEKSWNFLTSGFLCIILPTSCEFFQFSYIISTLVKSNLQLNYSLDIFQILCVHLHFSNVTLYTNSKTLPLLLVERSVSQKKGAHMLQRAAFRKKDCNLWDRLLLMLHLKNFAWNALKNWETLRYKWSWKMKR